MKSCPFCGTEADLSDPDTLHPSGMGWKLHPDGFRSYHSFREVPQEQWCWDMNCPETAGGCGATISGDSKQEAIDKWNRRAVC